MEGKGTGWETGRLGHKECQSGDSQKEREGVTSDELAYDNCLCRSLVYVWPVKPYKINADVKTYRKVFLMALLVTSVGIFPGCASPGNDSYAVVDWTTGLEKKQASPMDDLTPVQQTGYFLGWLSLASIYAFAGGNPSF